MSDDDVTFTREQATALLIAAERGMALQNWLDTTQLLGHTTPAGSLDYVHPEEGSAGAFVKDFVAWTSGRRHLAPGCEERLREFAQDGLREGLQAVAKRLDHPAA